MTCARSSGVGVYNLQARIIHSSGVYRDFIIKLDAYQVLNSHKSYKTECPIDISLMDNSFE